METKNLNHIIKIKIRIDDLQVLQKQSNANNHRKENNNFHRHSDNDEMKKKSQIKNKQGMSAALRTKIYV